MDKVKKAEEKASSAFEAEVAKLNSAFEEARTKLNHAEIILRRDVEMRINHDTTALENAHARSRALANDADAYLQGGNTKGLLNQIALSKQLVSAVGNEWLATLENSTHPKALANTAKHLAFTRCGELNLYGMVDAQIADLETKLFGRLSIAT